MLNIKVFLQELNNQFPLPAGSKAKHNITLAENGIVSVTLFINDKWQSFGFTDADLVKDGVVLAKEMRDSYDKFLKSVPV